MRHEDTVVAPMPSFERQTTSAWDEGVTRVRWAAQPTAPPPAFVPLHRPDATPTRIPAPAPIARVPALPATAEPLRAAPAAPAAAPAPATQPHGKVIVMFACRGGAGATTLSVNVAAAIARSGKSVCVLDLDLQLGDVFVALDLQPATSIAALAREADTIDGAALRRRLARHESGLYALSQTGRLDEIDPQLTERMPTLLATLAGHFDVVIVDGVRDFGDHALAALDMADQIALVVTQDVPSVRRAARVTQLFRKLGYSDRKIRLVLNRHASRTAIDDAHVERSLGVPVAARVRNDFARIRAALDQGALLQDIARGTPVARDVDALAGTLAGLSAGTAPVAKIGLVRRLFGRKR